MCFYFLRYAHNDSKQLTWLLFVYPDDIADTNENQARFTDEIVLA